MIVNTSVEGLHIIFHEAHGLLAGKIANQIHEKYRPPHWFETLIAVCEHDDRQLNFDEKDYLSDIGAPLDFTEEHSSVNDIMIRMKRILKAATNKSLWTKLLISYHLEFIYGYLREDSARVTNFLNDQIKDREKLLNYFKISNNQATSYYEFLRFCDRLSLILCKNEIPEAGRLLEINTSIDKQTYFIKKDNQEVISISPWIFKNAAIELSVEERILKEAQFSSSEKFKSLVMSTVPSVKKWTIKKS